ncbi:uncharacterized protein ColSpa_02311 [Colletotrichum spaethianum]|uniref:Uncharacterized protein n=1 Tax=Colletotrichum spaethianum TaxID=700344 RepID=A0AA37LA05_9PEZI|nr:uncharacterized protein ColSpa_02311 [Colletotrichum spaethianum]GKT42130.1 hypothetical protein ColSpa_02311 [Colletotrichum spaethianum]
MDKTSKPGTTPVNVFAKPIVIYQARAPQTRASGACVIDGQHDAVEATPKSSKRDAGSLTGDSERVMGRRAGH